MQLQNLVLVTIVTEQVTREQICDKIISLGASGCTWCEAQGSGSRGMRSSAVGGENVRIEVVCNQTTAEAILSHVSRHYFENYACIAWQTSISVVRGARYAGG